MRVAENTPADEKEMALEAHREMQRWAHVRASAICPHCHGQKYIGWPICLPCRGRHVAAGGKYSPEVLRSIRMSERAFEEANVFDDVFDEEWAAMERALGVRF